MIQFVRERFLPVPQIVLVVVMFAAGTLLARTVVPTETATTVVPLDDASPWRLLVGLALFMLLFFRLRLFDDVKDADHDRVYEQDRPIPRGLVTEGEVNAMAAAVLIIEAALAGSLGMVVFFAWVATAAWTVLMRVEFFVPEWLDRHVFTYAISHIVSISFAFMLLIAIGWSAVGADAVPSDLLEADRAVLWTTYLMAFLIGFGFELGRKPVRYVHAHGVIALGLWALLPGMGAAAATLVAMSEMPVWTVTAGVVLTFTIWISHMTVSMLVESRRTPDDTQEGPDGSPMNVTGELPMQSSLETLPALAGLIIFALIAAGGAAA